MWGSLGDVVFRLAKTPKRMHFSDRSRLPVLTPVRGKSIVQYTGDEPLEIELSILFHASFCDPKEEIEKLRSLKGLRLPLVINGEKWGDFAIEELSGELRSTTAGGKLISVEVTLRLKEVPDVGVGT